MTRIHTTILAAAITAAALAGSAPAGGFSITRSTIDGGGSQMSGGPFVLRGTVGQHDASIGPLSLGGFDVRGGFWTPAFAAAPCLADLAPPFGVLDLSDISTFINGFAAQDPIADLNNDNVWDLTDISMFVASFIAGCP